MNHYKDPNNGIHALSDEDITNGGEKYLPAGCVSITATEAYAILNPPPTAAQIHAALVASAKTALDATDMVAIRCIKASVTFPTDWQTYVTSLRAIVNGSDTTSTALPVTPSYPSGA